MKSKKREPLAILCSDLHLSLRPPVCRDDKDWMATQARYLAQVSDLSWELAKRSPWFLGKHFPVIIAGDIFDRWNPPPELLTFAFRHLPKNIWAVPGQHDLPNHREEEVDRSGYGVLIESGRINGLGHLLEAGNRYSLSGFGWGREVKPLEDSFRKYDPQEGKCIHVAVVHKYIFDTGSNAFIGAKEEDHISAFRERLAGYDVAVFGDNHKGFSTRLKSGTWIFNCGGFIRRKIDEVDYKPQIGILYNDGTVSAKMLDTSADRFKDAKEIVEEMEVDLHAFVEQLEKMGDHGLDFRAAVRKSLDGMEECPGPVKELVLKCLE